MTSVRVIVLFFLFATTARSAPLPPGHEAEVFRLVAGQQPSVGRVEAIRIGEQAIEVDLESADGLLTLALVPLDDRSPEPEVGRSASFSVRRRSGAAGEGARAAIAAFLAGLQSRDAGGFFASLEDAAASEPAARARSPGGWDDLKRAVTWAGLLVGLLLLALGASKSVNRLELLGLVLLIGLALCVRLWLPPHAPLHANAHGIAELRGLAATPLPWHATDESTRYGPAFLQAVRAVLDWFDAGSDAVFKLGAALGALSVAAAFALARSLSGAAPAGWVAAAGLTFLPVHIRVSASESPMTLAVLLALVGFAAWTASLREKDRGGRALLLAWTGAFALALGSELAVTTLAIAAAAVMYVVVAMPNRARLRTFVLPVLFVLLSAGVHLWRLEPILSEALAERGQALRPTVASFLGPFNVLFDRQLTSPALLPLGCLGLAVLAFKGRWRFAVGLVLAWFVVEASAFPVVQARTDLMRYQVLPASLLVVVAGLSGALVPTAFASRIRVFVALAVAALIIGTSVPGLTAIRQPTLDDSAYLAVKDAALRLPEHVEVVIPRQRGAQPFMDFPGFLLSEAGVDVRAVSSVDEAGSPCFVHVPAGCWAFRPEELEAASRHERFGGEAIREQCARLLQGIEPPAEMARQVDVPWREGEFYRVVANRPWVGLFPCASSDGGQ